MAIEALRHLDDVRLVIVGDGPLRGELASLARRLGVESRVTFRSSMPQRELRYLYSAVDVLLLTSTREGWPNVVLEAMACGTPVVAVDVGAVLGDAHRRSSRTDLDGSGSARAGRGGHGPAPVVDVAGSNPAARKPVRLGLHLPSAMGPVRAGDVGRARLLFPRGLTGTMYFAAAFVLFCLVCTVFAFTRHPIYGVYFYLATTYVFPPGRWWGYVFGDLRWALLAAAVTAMAVTFHRGKLKPKPVWTGNAAVVLLMMYVVWMWIQTPWALDTADHLLGTSEFTKCMLALWFVYRAVDSNERVRDLMLALVLGSGLLGVYAQFTGREGGRLDGVGGPNLDDSNSLSMYLAIGFVACLGLVLSQTGWRRYLSLAALPVIANGFVLANSRGSTIGLVAGVLVLAVCIASKHRWLFWSMAFAGVLAFGVIVDKVFIDRMFTIQDVTSEEEDADMSARSRLVIALAQLEMFVDYPMGSGRRGTAVLSPQYMDSRWLTGPADSMQRASHNTFLSALAEQGIPGAVIYVALVLWVIGAMFRLRRLNRPPRDPELTTLGAALCGGLMVVLVAGMTADYLVKEVQFWLYAGLVSVFWLSDAGQEEGSPSGEQTPARRVAGLTGSG